jgi:hypothetical protein
MANPTGAGGFKPGRSGNPDGRPKVAAEFRQRARKAVDDHVIAAWIAEVEAQGEHWVKCSELLAAYGYGKPTQPMEHSGPDGAPAFIDVRFIDAKGPK